MNKNAIRILTKIHNASVQGNLSFFVGAGVSMLSGQPSWIDLLKNIKLICDLALKVHNSKINVPIDNIIDKVLKAKKKGR